MPRLALVTPSFAPSVGGVETHVGELARRMGFRGWEVEVLTQMRTGTDAPAAETTPDGVRVNRFPAWIGGVAAPGLARHLARSRYDVVHAHAYHALPALIAAASRPRTLVFTPHYHGTGGSPLRTALHTPYRPLGGRVFAAAAVTIAVSHAEAGLIASHFPRAAERTRVIPNGVDIEGIVAAARVELGGTALLIAGRLVAHKNLGRAIQALAHLDETHRLWVSGDGPQREALQRLASDAGVAQRVTFTGSIARDELDRLFRSADAVLAISEQESFGITLVEGLASGASVVASDIPSHREIAAMAPGAAIRFVEPDVSPEHLATEIVAAIGDRTSASPDLTGLPTWERVADLTADAYADAVARTVKTGG